MFFFFCSKCHPEPGCNPGESGAGGGQSPSSLPAPYTFLPGNSRGVRRNAGGEDAPGCFLDWGDQVCSLSAHLFSLQKNWGREEEGAAGCYPRTEVLGWWLHLKVLVVTVRLFWVISSPCPSQVPGLESLGARGRHQQGGPGAASSSDVPSVWLPLSVTSYVAHKTARCRERW